MKPLIYTFFIVTATLLVFASCQEKAKKISAPSFNLDSARVEIEHQNEVFQAAFEKGDSVGLANLFTVDGKIMMAGAPAFVGREAITHLGAMFIKSKLKRAARTVDIWGGPEMIVEEGIVSLFDQTGKEVERAKYLEAWKQEDGQWRLFRDMWTTDLAPASK